MNNNGMQKIIEDKVDSLRELCRTYDVKRMYVFGSVCTDNFKENSDIDILISFKDISIEKYTDNYFELHYKLEQLFNRKIDLITENSLSNPYFIESIEETKQLLYAAWNTEIFAGYYGVYWINWEYLSDNHNFDTYKTNKLLRRGIERELEIIGEAINRILRIDNKFEIPDSRRIVDLRNWVIHGYDKVDDIIIWGIISKDLPILKLSIEKLLINKVNNQ